MSDTAAQTAIDVLLDIATDGDADTGARIAAACSILDRLDKIPAEAGVPA